MKKLSLIMCAASLMFFSQVFADVSLSQPNSNSVEANGGSNEVITIPCPNPGQVYHIGTSDTPPFRTVFFAIKQDFLYEGIFLPLWLSQEIEGFPMVVVSFLGATFDENIKTLNCMYQGETPPYFTPGTLTLALAPWDKKNVHFCKVVDNHKFECTVASNYADSKSKAIVEASQVGSNKSDSKK